MAKPLVVLSRRLPISAQEQCWSELKEIANVVVPTRVTPIANQRGLKNAVGIIPLVTDVIDSKLISKLSKLKVIANYGVGYNNIDVAAATQRQIVVCNTPDVLTNATAELTIGLIFAAARRFKEGSELIRKKAFKFWDPNMLLGREISGARLGIIGFGRIGQAVAQKALALGMRVGVYTRVKKPNRFSDIEFLSFENLLKTSDFVSIHCPLSKDTFQLIGRQQLALMKPTSFLINTARGEIIDELALIAALNSQKIAGAALDVFCGEPRLRSTLRSNSNVFVLPHIGSATIEARSGMARLAIQGVLDVLNGRDPKNRVN